MDAQRFDAALRALQAGTTRRAGLAGALGALLGGSIASEVAGAAGKRDVARGVGRPHGEGPCGDGSRKDNSCTKDKQCCTGVCDTAAGRTNGDGKGRCRCVRKGDPCTADKNCCREMPCTNGVCGHAVAACRPATCKKGCCDGTTCVKATSASACGTGGAACASCSSLAPVCSAGVCSTGTWTPQTTFGTEGDGNDNFYNPPGIFVSNDTLTAWVADYNNNRIVVWTRSDRSSTTWSYSAQFGTSGIGNDNFSYPEGVFVSSDTLTAWVADRTNSRISIWTRPDRSSTSWGYSAQFGTSGSGSGNLSAPTGVFVSANTLTAWVADSGNNRIAVWTRPDSASTTWSPSTQFGTSGSDNSNFNHPFGVFVSADTLTAWVADAWNNRISIWTRPDPASTSWGYSTQFGTLGSGNENLDGPKGVFVSADTLTVWVADRNNDRIAIWSRLDSSSTTWSYSAQFGAKGSGPGNFDREEGVFVSADSLAAWIADVNNNRIAVWTQS